MTMLYFLVFSLCSGGFFCLMLSQTPHAKTMLGRPVQHPARLRLAGATLLAAASTSWFGCLSAGAALCAVAVYFRGKGAGKKDKRSYD